jgi:hypothetical protein
MPTKMPNDAAAERAGSAENSDDTIVHGYHGSSLPPHCWRSRGRSKRSNIWIDGWAAQLSASYGKEVDYFTPLDSCACGAIPVRATASTALTMNVVFKFIDNELLFRNYSLKQIADGDNADDFTAFEHR